MLVFTLFRSLIQWAKGEVLIARGGSKKARKRDISSGRNAFVTRKGSLRIPGIGYQDAGIYTCMGKTYFFYSSFFITVFSRKQPKKSDFLIKIGGLFKLYQVHAIYSGL